jgi:hypothetical protein
MNRNNPHGHGHAGVAVTPSGVPDYVAICRQGYWGYGPDGYGIYTQDINHEHAIPSAGGGSAHNVTPPYRTVRWITVAA